jgi:arginine/ornithine transport system substrate-binding protein
VNVQVYKSLDNAILDLQSGRVDFVFDDEIGISEGFLKRPEGAGYGFVGPAVTAKKYYGGMAMAVRKGDETLRNDLNKGLADVVAAGTFKELSIKYFGFDVSKSQ